MDNVQSEKYRVTPEEIEKKKNQFQKRELGQFSIFIG